MTPEEAPVGTRVILGHVNNGVTATKRSDGWWTDAPRYCRRVDPEDVARSGHDATLPPEGYVERPLREVPHVLEAQIREARRALSEAREALQRYRDLRRVLVGAGVTYSEIHAAPEV